MLEERESSEVRLFFESDLRLVSSAVLRVELMRAIRRAGFTQELQEKSRRVLERIHLFGLDEPILARAENIPPRTLRALDALHLATALELSPSPEVFLCYDERLGAAARWHGLAVVAPGVDDLHEP